jgi:hypothetical protein
LLYQLSYELTSSLSLMFSADKWKYHPAFRGGIRDPESLRSTKPARASRCFRRLVKHWQPGADFSFPPSATYRIVKARAGSPGSNFACVNLDEEIFMRKNWIRIAMGCSLCGLALFAWSQGKGKAGLWEVTTTRTMGNMPQMPQGMPPGMAARMGGGPTTTQVCVTQAMVDKYSGPPPQTRGDCQVSNMTTKPDGYSAEVTCTGRFTGKGTVDTTIVDSDHVKSTVHITGAGGPQGQQMDMTMQSTAVYKGADCGSVQPPPMPKDQ